MGRRGPHKVCWPVAGRPSIVRLLDTLRRDGVDPLIVVVGHGAGEVVETIGSANPGVYFLFQRDRLGTGHAARIGIEALARMGYAGAVLITMGDKWIGPDLIRRVHRRFAESGAELLLVGQPKRAGSLAGRLVHVRRRGVAGIVELRDLERSRLLRHWSDLADGAETLSKAQLRRAGLTHIRPAAKLWKALGPLARFARGTGLVRASELAQEIRETGVTIDVGGCPLSPEEIERQSPLVNASLYVGRLATIRSALQRVGRANAQDEYYLTDMIGLIGRSAAESEPADGGAPRRPGRSSGVADPRVVEYRLRSSTEVMAFNTPCELARIEEHVRRQEAGAAAGPGRSFVRRYLRPPAAWLDLLDQDSPRAARLIEQVYGGGGPLVRDRLRILRRVVRLFAQSHGPSRPLFLVRAPGRVNLMGRHIDHQGGFVHALAIDAEVRLAVAPRSDDVIRLVNANPVAFPPRELVVSDWHGALAAPDWATFVNSEAVRSHLLSTVGDWSNYVLAAALFLQFHHPGRRLRGMDVAVVGDVPMAAGLSSSSALVVASMAAVAAANGFHLSGPEIVTNCGQAEWFVGSRGGAADHAAIRLGRAGYAARMSFHPFRLRRYVPLPPRAALLIAASGQHAVKSAGARDRFNERVACYRLGVLLLQHRHPELASRLEYIRDLSPARLRMSVDQVLALVRELPARITRPALRARLGPAYADRLQRVFASHGDPGQYTIRDVVAFGVGECARARLAAELLDGEKLREFGEMMKLSHDGDRVSGLFSSSGEVVPRDGTPLPSMCGAYACSTERIDRLIDLAQEVPGVYGAQLAGAGLGGCITIMADQAAAGRVKRFLAAEYYRPLGLAPDVREVRSVSGGGLIPAAMD